MTPPLVVLDSAASDPRTHARADLRRRVAAAKPRTPDRNFTFKAPLRHGWLMPVLFWGDNYLTGRWDYLAETRFAGQLLPDPIPQIHWEVELSARCPGRRYLEAALNTIPSHGEWQTWGGSTYFEYFLDWLLFAFGHHSHPAEPAEPLGCEGASARLYQVFCLEALLAFPADYLGDILADAAYGRGAGFFPTPLCLTELITRMTFGEGDLRAETVCDPCVGTGRFLLSASNFSLRLFGQDINSVMVKCTLVNGYLYAPWLARALPEAFFAAHDQARAAAEAARPQPRPPLGTQLELLFAERAA